jgi:hypothetical protein
MGSACSTYSRDEKYEDFFSQKNMKGRDHLGDLGKDGRMP